ncbi:MAG: hypothetical protein D6738_01625 [Acidobacteria bacterium]|nr:MAG: hypothetical protein D6738_01625 [Acidobacteriota bacterium]
MARASRSGPAPFVPPHCPRRDCPAHRLGPGEPFRFQRRGSRVNRRRGDRVEVFFCLHGAHWFSSAAFDTEYWLQRRGLLGQVFRLLCEGQSQRQAARSLGVSPGVVARCERRLARQALLLLLTQRRALEGRLTEDVVLDGLRTFAGSQDEPLDLNTAITVRSRFVLDVVPAPLRRSGAMRPSQRARRAARERRLGRPDPQARRRATRATLCLLLRLLAPGREIALRTDEEPDYARALADLGAPAGLRHETTSSRARRDTANPLWAVNHLHGLMRHALKSHARETLGFHKRLAGLLDRALVFTAWHNNTKGLSERRRDLAQTTPAMVLGLADRPLSGEELFARRRFPAREGLPEALRPVYEGRVVARPREPMTRRVPVFAY